MKTSVVSQRTSINVAFFKGAVMQGVNFSDCSYAPIETMWAGFTHWTVFPLGCLIFIKNGWEDHSGNFTINQNYQASLFLKVMHGSDRFLLKRTAPGTRLLSFSKWQVQVANSNFRCALSLAWRISTLKVFSFPIHRRIEYREALAGRKLGALRSLTFFLQ